MCFLTPSTVDLCAGDAQWTSEEAALNLDTTLFYENFVRTFQDTQAVGCNHVAETVLNAPAAFGLTTASSVATTDASAGSFVICSKCVANPANVYWFDVKQRSLHHIVTHHDRWHPGCIL